MKYAKLVLAGLILAGCETLKKPEYSSRTYQGDFLTAEEIETEIVGRQLTGTLTYKKNINVRLMMTRDGRWVGSDNGHPFRGTYEVQDNGTVCKDDDDAGEWCFKLARDEGVLLFVNPGGSISLITHGV